MISRKKICAIFGNYFALLTFVPENLSINLHSGANIFGQHCIPGNKMKTRWMKRNFILWNWTRLKEVLCTTETIYLVLLKKICFEWGLGRKLVGRFISTYVYVTLDDNCMASIPVELTENRHCSIHHAKFRTINIHS